jgi:hypothetical protein
VPSLTQPLFEFRLFKRSFVGDNQPDQVRPASALGADDQQQAAGTAGLLDVQLRDLQLMVNQETLVVLVKFVNTNVLRPLKRRAHPIVSSETISSPRSSPMVPSPRGNITAVTPSSSGQAQSATSSSSSSLRVAASLGCIKFILNRGGQHLAEGYLDRSRFEVFPDPQGCTRVEGNVGHLKLLDLVSSFASSPSSSDQSAAPSDVVSSSSSSPPSATLDSSIARAFQEIIMVQGDTDALTFTLKLARRTTAEQPPAVEGSSLVVRATGVKILLVHQFFSRLLGYAAELRSIIAPPPPPSSSSSSPTPPTPLPSAAETSSSTVDAPPDLPFRLVVLVKNGSLLLPERWSDSMSVALASIGSFSITNDRTGNAVVSAAACLPFAAHD